MENNIRTFARVGLCSPFLFLDVSYESFNKHNELKKELEHLKQKGRFEHDGTMYYNEFEKINELENELLKEIIKTVIFTSSFLESYFFDYSAIALGQGFTEKFIERINLLSKIVLIPKLVSGKELNRELNYWSSIKDLIDWRNKFIHNKTKDALGYLSNINNKLHSPLYELINLDNFFKSLYELFKNLDEIDPSGAHLHRFEIRM